MQTAACGRGIWGFDAARTMSAWPPTQRLQHSSRRSPGPWPTVLAGAVALAVAMGIGRFAFTPLLPMMLADGTIDLNAASWLASANYLGYLAGAVLCTFQPRIWSLMPGLPAVDAPWMVRFGLVATGMLTLAMALPLPAVWPVLRFAAGVASALVFVYTSGWCLAQLAAHGAGALGGAVFTGPGAGIVLSGVMVSAMVAWHWSPSSGWLAFGVLAFALSACVWRLFRGATSTTGAASATDAGAARHAAAPDSTTRPAEHGRTELAALALAYGLAGFGYIITATFLPVIARAALPGSAWPDLFWPLFGLGVVVGAALATRVRVRDLRLALAACYLMQATAIAAGLWSPTIAGFALGSLLLGLPFTAITFFAMQEVRRLQPQAVASTTGLLTAMYGTGQIVGPPLAAYLLRSTGSEHAGFTLALEIASSALLVGAAMYLWMSRTFPRAP